MGRRGPRKDDLKLRLLWNLLAGGYRGARAIEFSGLARRTAYEYIDFLVADKALRRIDKFSGRYEPLPDGLKYKSEIGQNSAQQNNSAHPPEKLRTPPYAGGRAPPSHGTGSPDPTSPSQKEEMARADDVSASREQMDPIDEAQPGPVAGPEAPPQEQPPAPPEPAPEAREAGQAAGPATAPNGLPLLDESPEDVRPAPPVPLGHPARLHHRAVRLAIVRPPDRHPVPDILRWGPPKKDSHGDDWYKSAEVLFSDLGIVTFQEFNTCIRLWLPEYTVHDRAALERAVVHDLGRDAQRVANWLQKNYGYQLGLPEPDELHVAFPLPDIAGRFKGWFKCQLDDGTMIVIDKSKGWAEIEFLARPASLSTDLRTILNWGCAPRLLTALQDRLIELEQRLPLEIRAGTASTIQEAIPALADAVADKVEKRLGPRLDRAEQPYQPPGPGDNIGYG